MGPSGCGKTTLLNLLGGVDRPSSGTILIDGQDLDRDERARRWRVHRLRRVGFVFQFFNLIPSITALENIELPMVMAGKPDDSAVIAPRHLLGLVGLEAKGHKRPEELSGGEQQRVGVALALANDPALILADEPTGNLDSDQRECDRNAPQVARDRARQDRDHGEPRSENRRSVSHRICHAGRAIRHKRGARGRRLIRDPRTSCRAARIDPMRSLRAE